MILRSVALGALALTGCATSRDLATASRTVQIREELVGGKLVKLRTVTITNASEQESATTALDGALIGAQISEAVGAAIKSAIPLAAPISAGVDWASALASGGALATAAASGYLAVKKREQIRAQPKKASA